MPAKEVPFEPLETKEAFHQKEKIEKEILEIACVQGETFSFPLLWKTQNLFLQEKELYDFLEHLQNLGLIQREDTPKPSPLLPFYSFCDIHYPKSLYDHLEKEKQEKIHLSIAHSMQEIFPQPSSKQFTEMLRHWAGADSWDKYSLCCGLLAKKLRRKNLHEAFGYALKCFNLFSYVMNPGIEEKKIFVDILMILGLDYAHQIEENEKKEALSHYNNAFSIAQEISYEDAIPRILYYQGQWQKKDGNLIKAQEYWQKGLEKAKDSRKKMIFYLALGRLFLLQFDLPKAQKNILKGLSLAREVKNLPWEQNFLHALALVHKREGNWNLAQDQYQKSACLAEAQKDTRGKAQALFLSALLSFQQGRWKESENRLKESGNLFHSLKWTQKQGEVLCLLAKVEIAKGEYQKALQKYKECYVLLENSPICDKKIRRWIYHGTGDALSQAGEYEKSQRYYHEAIYLNELRHTQKAPFPMQKNAQVYRRSGDWEQAEKILHKALEISQKSQQITQESAIWKKLGDHFLLQYNLEEAQTYYQKSLELKKQTGDLPGESFLLEKLAWVSFYMGNIKESYEFLQKSLKIRKKLGMTGYQADTFLFLGDLYCQQENWEEAMRQYETSYTIYKQCNSIKKMARAKERIGFVFLRNKQYQNALRSFLYALEVYKNQDNKKGMGRLFLRLGQLYNKKNNLTKALVYFQEALSLYEQAGSSSGMASALNEIGRYKYYSGLEQEAITFYEKALSKSQEARDIFLQGKIYHNIGEFFLSQNKLLKAMENFSQSIIQNEKIHYLQGLGLAYRSIAKTYLSFHRPDKAILNLQKSLECSEKFPDKRKVAHISLQLAKLCAQDAKENEAKEYYKKALSFYKTQNRFMADLIESEIESLE